MDNRAERSHSHIANPSVIASHAAIQTPSHSARLNAEKIASICFQSPTEPEERKGEPDEIEAPAKRYIDGVFPQLVVTLAAHGAPQANLPKLVDRHASPRNYAVEDELGGASVPQTDQEKGHKRSRRQPETAVLLPMRCAASMQPEAA